MPRVFNIFQHATISFFFRRHVMMKLGRTNISGIKQGHSLTQRWNVLDFAGNNHHEQPHHGRYTLTLRWAGAMVHNGVSAALSVNDFDCVSWRSVVEHCWPWSVTCCPLALLPRTRGGKGKRKRNDETLVVEIEWPDDEQAWCCDRKMNHQDTFFWMDVFLLFATFRWNLGTLLYMFLQYRRIVRWAGLHTYTWRCVLALLMHGHHFLVVSLVVAH